MRLAARLWLKLEAAGQEVRRQASLRQMAAVGDNVTLRSNVLIQNPKGIRLGSNVFINHHCLLNGGGGISIGNNVVVGPSSMILTTNHRGEIFFGNIVYSPVRIGTNVWIGANVVISPGAIVGDNVVIAAGAVVSREIPDDSIAGGVPAKVLKLLELPFEPATMRERP